MSRRRVNALSEASSTQAHLTPHNRRRRDLNESPSTSRPSRNRRPPAWIENDGIVTVSTPTSTTSRVVVDVPRHKAVMVSPSKHSFRTAAVYGKGKGKGRKVESESSSEEEEESSSSSDSSEEEMSVPQTPSRRGRPRKDATPQRSPSKSKLQAGPLTPSRKAITTTPKTSDATPKASANTPATPRAHPRPIKRPRLSANGTTPARSPRAKQPQQQAAATPSSIGAPSKPFVQPTSADFYFAAHTSRRKTSALANTQSWSVGDDKKGGLQSLPALTPKEVAALGRPGSRKDPFSTAGLESLAKQCYRTQYEQWKSMLFMGNDLLFYGVGSMERVLEDFVRTLVEDEEAEDDDSATPPIDAVIIRGRTSMRSEEWISRIEEVLDMPLSSTVVSSDARVARIVQWLADHGSSHLVVLVHSLDSPALLNPRTRSHMQHLTASPYVHLLGSTTHPNAHLLDGYVRHPRKRLLWVPCTTLVPMLDDALLSGAGVKLGGLPRQFDLLTGSGGSMSVKVPHDTHDTGAGSAASLATQANAPLLTSTAATHVLRSVTTRARALFNLIANELIKQAATGDSSQPWQSRSIPYTRLHNLASRNFLASSESAMRALLVEFTSHGLIRVSRDEAAEGEVVGIRIASQQEVKDVIEACKKM